MNRIKQMRLAKGLSLEDLAKAMGGIVTKQALSKYEKGSSRPRPSVAISLAAVLGVKTIHLWTPPPISVDFVAYRRRSRFSKKEQSKIEAFVGKTLEERCLLQQRLGLSDTFDWMKGKFPIRKSDDAEAVAKSLRGKWDLGTDAISDLTSILENRLVHVLEMESGKEFDGISALAKNENGQVIAAAVMTRKATTGDRQRMNLAHELGHLVLAPRSGIDEEEAAFRFAGAFLLPAETLSKEIGIRRFNLQLTELLTLKRRFGISLQAILRRLSDLEVISTTAYKWWMIEIGRKGWRKEEPEPLPPEIPTWPQRMLTRAVAEGALTTEEARSLGGSGFCDRPETVLSPRAAFLRLPPEQRRKKLEAQALQIRNQYRTIRRENDLETGELEDYDS